MHRRAARKQLRRHPGPARYRKLAIIVAVIAGIVAVLFLAFLFVKPFREALDNLYYELYSAFYVEPAVDDVASVRRNVAYCDTTSRFQKLDVYIPYNSTGPVPAVVYIHGGGWSVGDKIGARIRTQGAEILRNKMALVSINYRLAPQATYPAQNQDVACAIDYLRENGQNLGIDTENIGLWGDSAGGQLAAMAALDPQFKPFIKGVVEFYGTGDVWAQISHKPKADKWAVAYIGSANDKAKAMRASAVNANMIGAPPFLLFHGTDDHVVPYNQSVTFQERLQAAGVDATLRTVKHANHNFDARSRPTDEQIMSELIAFFEQRFRINADQQAPSGQPPVDTGLGTE